MLQYNIRGLGQIMLHYNVCYIVLGECVQIAELSSPSPASHSLSGSGGDCLFKRLERGRGCLRVEPIPERQLGRKRPLLVPRRGEADERALGGRLAGMERRLG